MCGFVRILPWVCAFPSHRDASCMDVRTESSLESRKDLHGAFHGHNSAHCTTAPRALPRHSVNRLPPGPRGRVACITGKRVHRRCQCRLGTVAAALRHPRDHAPRCSIRKRDRARVGVRVRLEVSLVPIEPKGAVLTAVRPVLVPGRPPIDVGPCPESYTANAPPPH